MPALPADELVLVLRQGARTTAISTTDRAFVVWPFPDSDLRFDDRSFDTVNCMEVLEHLVDPRGRCATRPPGTELEEKLLAMRMADGGQGESRLRQQILLKEDLSREIVAVLKTNGHELRGVVDRSSRKLAMTAAHVVPLSVRYYPQEHVGAHGPAAEAGQRVGELGAGIAPSAKTCRSHGWSARIEASSGTAPSRSWTGSSAASI